MKIFKELYQYRELLKSNVKKEIRGKYKGSFLGVIWSFVNPLLTVLVYAIIFPYILRQDQDNYLIFLIVAIIPWNFFVTVLNQGTTTILANANIIKKVYFPREILPLSIVLSGLVNFLISCIIILFFVLFGGLGISPVIFYLPIIILIQFALSLGIVFMISAINVYIRDVEYIVNFVLTLAFYATPILYDASFMPAKIQGLLNLNPMKHLIDAYRSIFYYKQTPNFAALSILALFSFGILIFGYAIFKKLERGFAEEV